MNIKSKAKNKQSYLKRNKIVIQTRDDLIKIKSQKHPLLKRPRRTNFSVQLPYISDDQRTYYEQKLSKNYSACGCELGAALGFISLITFVVVLSVSGSLQWSWMLVLYGMMVFSLGVLLGKITGLTRANMRVKRIIEALSQLTPTIN